MLTRNEALVGTAEVHAAPSGLSQGQRLVDTFVAPSATFTDVRRSASWWLPFLVIALCSYLLVAAVQTKVGWAQLASNEIQANPKLSERLATVPPEQLAQQRRVMAYSMQGGFYAAPLLSLGSVALIALILWGTINFGFGGSATFGRVYCVGMYASLPGALSALIAAGLLFAGRDPESFSTQNMVASNAGYFLDTPGALKTLLTSLDVFSLWSVVLWGLGLAIVARVKPSHGVLAVFGWFLLVVLVRAGWVAATS